MSRWNDAYRNARRAQRRGERGMDAKFVLLLLAGALLIASGILTWNIQRYFTGNTGVALTMTFLLTLAPPVLTSFLIPWSPAGMLLFSINMRTVGQAVVIAAVLFFLYYTFTVQSAWWAAQPGAAQAQMPAMQTIAGIIGFIVIPALVWAPVSRDELQEVVQQDHDVRRYRLMVAADIAILQKTLMNAQQAALVGFANLAANQRADLVGIMRGLVTGIDRLQQEAFGNMRQATGLAYSVQSIADDPEIIELLDRAEDVFTGRLIAEPEPEQVIERTAAQRPDAASAPAHAAVHPHGSVSAHGSAQDVPQGVIDVGGRTTDLFWAQGMKPMQDRCEGAPVGVEKAGDLFAATFARSTGGRALGPQEVRAVLRAAGAGQAPPPLYIDGKPAQLDGLIDAALRSVGEEIASFVARVWRTGEDGRVASDAARVLLIGGGAYYVRKPLKQLIPHLEVPSKPELANAQGYLALGLKIPPEKWAALGAR